MSNLENTEAYRLQSDPQTVIRLAGSYLTIQYEPEHTGSGINQAALTQQDASEAGHVFTFWAKHGRLPTMPEMLYHTTQGDEAKVTKAYLEGRYT